MPEIIIAVQNKLPILAGTAQHIVADNSDYTIRFLFDDQWEEGEKTVYFVRSNGYAYAPVKTVDGVVQVPVQTDVNLMSQLLIGVRQGKVKTSRPCGIAVYPAISNIIKDDAVQPDESLWEQVLDRLDWLEENGGGGSGSGGGIYIGPEETMPAGTKVRIDPNGKRVEIPGIDDTLTKQGYAADAKAVGDALGNKFNKQQGIENAGKLMFVGEGGEIIPLALGAGLKIKDGVLMIVNAAVTAAICGQFKCGEVVCGGTK